VARINIAAIIARLRIIAHGSAHHRWQRSLALSIIISAWQHRVKRHGVALSIIMRRAARQQLCRAKRRKAAVAHGSHHPA